MRKTEEPMWPERKDSMMKRIFTCSITWMLLTSLFLMAGCGGSADVQTPDDAPVGGITEAVGGSASEEELAMLMEVFGFSEEMLAAMSEEEISALLADLGAVRDAEAAGDADNGKAENAPAAKGPTLSDVSGGGSYIVTVGDSMMWNYLELYYENGQLQKIVMHFQKSGDEEPEVSVLEGEEARACTFYWIDFTASPESVAGALEDAVGYTNVYVTAQ